MEILFSAQDFIGIYFFSFLLRKFFNISGKLKVENAYKVKTIRKYFDYEKSGNQKEKIVFFFTTVELRKYI